MKLSSSAALMISGGASRSYVGSWGVDHKASRERGIDDSRRDRLGQDHGLEQTHDRVHR